MTADFADQLSEVESLINSHSDCHVIVDRIHTPHVSWVKASEFNLDNYR
jgi:hypothetical protein